jgi:hypothetical protein
VREGRGGRGGGERRGGRAIVTVLTLVHGFSDITHSVTYCFKTNTKRTSHPGISNKMSEIGTSNTRWSSTAEPTLNSYLKQS